MVCKEKNKNEKIEKIVLDDITEKKLNQCLNEIEVLINSTNVPNVENDKKCSKCAYYEYCYI